MKAFDSKQKDSNRAELGLTGLKRSDSNVIELFCIGSMIKRFMQIGLIALVFLCGMLVTTSLSQELSESTEQQGPPPVIIRSSLSPESGIYVGQKARLFVEVLTNTWFAKAPQFPELRIPHAICLELSQFGVNFSERIEGEAYAAQRKEYVIYPQRLERYSVPSLTVKISYARPGESPGEVTLISPPQEFEARVPEDGAPGGPGADGPQDRLALDAAPRAPVPGGGQRAPGQRRFAGGFAQESGSFGIRGVERKNRKYGIQSS